MYANGLIQVVGALFSVDGIIIGARTLCRRAVGGGKLTRSAELVVILVIGDALYHGTYDSTAFSWLGYCWSTDNVQ